MTEELKEFIESHIDLIDNNQYEELYSLAELELRPSETSEIGLELNNIGVNVLDYMRAVPTGFMYQQKDIDTWRISEQNQSVGVDAFAVSGIQYITIPHSVKVIDDLAFDRCHQLESVIIEPGCEYIGRKAFRESGINDIIIPDTISDIDQYCFIDSTIKTLRLSKKMTVIKAGLCEYCPVLRYVYIPDSIHFIEDSAFANCGSLKEIGYGGTIQQWEEIDKAINWRANTPTPNVICTDGITV